jgi:glycosyltransferase involved in cell wall biosynthesis
MMKIELPESGTMYDVSVVVPAYKAANTLPRLLDSLSGQSGVNLDVVVVEDGIFDNTAEILSQYSNVRHVFFEMNQGACNARNHGLECAEHDFVMFIDADDYVEGNLLYGLAHRINKTNADVALGPCVARWSYKEKPLLPSWRDEVISHHVARRWLTNHWGPGPSAIMWRAASIREIGAWNPCMVSNQDGELMIRAALSGLGFCVSDMGRGVYAKDDADQSVSKQCTPGSLESQEIVIKFVREWLEKSGGNLRDRIALSTFILRQVVRAYYYGHDGFAKKWSAYTSRIYIVFLRSSLSYKIAVLALGPKLGVLCWRALNKAALQIVEYLGLRS